MNNLDIVLALFTTPNHRFSRLDTDKIYDTTAAFQAATSRGAGISIIGGGGGGGGGGGQIFIYSCSAQLISFEIDCFYSL